MNNSLDRTFEIRENIVLRALLLQRSAQLQYNYNQTAIQQGYIADVRSASILQRTSELLAVFS